MTATAAPVVVMVATAATATVATATAAAVVLWQVVGGGIAYQHHTALIFHIFAGKAVVKIHCYLFVTYIYHEPLCGLSGRCHHGQRLSHLYHVGHEITVGIVENAAFEFHHKAFVA